MIEQEKREQNWYTTEDILKEVREDLDVAHPTAKEVLTHICGDREGYSNSNYVIFKYYGVDQERSFIQRLNTLWVYPLFILSIPLQFLFTGTTGIQRNSRIGKILYWLIKFD